jgi:hypothetical protein
MAAFNKFNDFAEQLGLGKHNLNTDTLKVMLTNTAPVATNTVLANITEITAQNGYTAGGEDTQNTYSETSGTGSCVGVDVVWTATGAGFGPFRYVVLYNDTQTSPAKPLIGWWDYGSSISLTTAGETFTTDFGASMFTIA